MIKSRYTIEYIDPEPNGKTEEKKNVALFTFLGLIILAALVYSFIPISKPNQPAKVLQDTQDQIIETIAGDNNATNNEQASQPTTQLVANKKLSDSINNLTKQLMSERKTYKTLDKQLNVQKDESNQLSELLEGTPSKVNKAEKRYLSVLNSLEENSKTDEIFTKLRKNNKLNTIWQ